MITIFQNSFLPGSDVAGMDKTSRPHTSIGLAIASVTRTAIVSVKALCHARQESYTASDSILGAESRLPYRDPKNSLRAFCNGITAFCNGIPQPITSSPAQ